MPSRLESKSCLETFNGNALRAPNLTDSHNSIPEESHRIATQPKCNQIYLLAHHLLAPPN